MMNRWKITITATAASVTGFHGDSSSTSGVMISTNVPPPCAIVWASRDGRMSRGKSR